jgi:hypothetical protein
MLLARFRRYAAGAAEPETGSENSCGADALSGFAYRARPPTVNPLDGSENTAGGLYTYTYALDYRDWNRFPGHGT